MNRRLYRSPDDRVLAGVAGGMAETYDMDPSLVRVAWALLIIFTGGVFLILYVIMALVVPLRSEPYAPAAGQAPSDETEPGYGPSETTPGSATGFAAPVRNPRRGRDSDNSGTLIFGTILVIIGALFLLRQFVDIDIGRLWPLAIIGLGILLVVSAFGRRDKPS